MPATTGGSTTVRDSGSSPTRGDARAHDRLSAPVSQPSTKRRSSSDTATLAPLHILQGARRGSITDPSLHAAATTSLTTSTSASTSTTGLPSPRRSQSDSHQTRRLLDSPSVQRHSPLLRHAETAHVAPGPSFMTSPRQRGNSLSQSPMQSESDSSRRISGHSRQNSSASQSSHLQSPLLLAPAGTQGTKRKMSIENVSFPRTSTGDIDPQLVGPGSGLVDAEAPAGKRRGSIASQTMSHLNLHERRNSLETRGPPQAPVGMSSPGANATTSAGGGGQQWWVHDRRGSNPPPPSFPSGTHQPQQAQQHQPPQQPQQFSTTGFPAEAPHGRPPPPVNMPPLAWPGPAGPQGASLVHGEPDVHMSASARPFDPSTGPTPTMPQIPFTHDRRMSAPSNFPAHPATSPTAARTLRSRSRPTSSGEGIPPNVVDPDDSGGSSSGAMQPKGATPYSRSPELRVSHKLAERKRRKEMKDLFDELRDQLPADRGMKASKWEILSKAVDFISQMKASHQAMTQEIESLRHELDAARQALPFGAAASAVGAGAFSPHHPVAFPPLGNPALALSRPGSAHPTHNTDGASPTSPEVPTA